MHVRSPVILWLGIGLVAAAGLLLAALNIYQAIAIGPAFEQDRSLVAHTFDVIQTSEQLQISVQDAERGQRGYLITGNETYLEPYRSGTQTVPMLLAKLEQLAVSNADQSRRLVEIETQINTKLTELAQTVEARRVQGFDPARRIVETNVGLDAMRTIADEINAVIATESALLTQQLAKVSEDERSIATLAETGVGLTILIVGLGAILIFNSVNAWMRQQKTLQETRAALAQSQKMETLGQLSGGIAHDFNNMLAIIKGGVVLLQRRLQTTDPDIKRFIDGIDDAANRAATLTQGLLAFARRQPLEPKAIDLNKLVAGMSDILHRALGENAAIETVLAAGLWPASIDANQLENAILNLAVNARDAMPGGGKVTLETGNVHLDEAYARNNDEVTAGQYVMIAVSDTGGGMTLETAKNAFEPFFTTKPLGQGTGLGLSQVYGFVKQSRGHVKIYSELGKGTTVKLYLPRFMGQRQKEESRIATAAAKTATPSRRTVLLVEDEENLRVFTAESLEDKGYRVLSASDGKSALQLLDAEPEVDLLFTDVGLPNGMNGRELADEARRRRPQLRVLFMTGYARNAIVHHGRLDPGVELIVKPFTQGDLAHRLQKLLPA